MYIYTINSWKHQNLDLNEFYDGELIGEVTFQKFGRFDPYYDVTKSKLGAKRAQMYIYSINRVRSLKHFSQMYFMMENSLVRLLFRNFPNLTHSVTSLNLNQGQKGPQMYVYSINSQKLENLHLDEFYDGEFIGEVTFQKFPKFDPSYDVSKSKLWPKVPKYIFIQ